MEASTDKPIHHCGVAGFHEVRPANVPEKLFYALFSLQHRGQESCGISYLKEDRLVAYKDLGMVSDVLQRYLQLERPSRVGIGHVRYSTHGGNRIENAQPIVVNCNKGRIALAHNGNLSNTPALKEELAAEGSIFQSTSDSEVILHLIARSRQPDFYRALKETLERIDGAFSLVMIHNDTLVALRDPSGFRPLYIGSKEGTTLTASETCALETLGITDYREVAPGELIIVNDKGFHSELYAGNRPRSSCIFELIYFARPDSRVFDHSVYMTRKKMGAALARCDEVRGDIVVPVPDSGNSAATGYAEAAGLPLEQGLTRNHYVGRSFILPTTAQRELAVRMKLHPVREAIAGKRIILIDDSLVRGTTSRILVKMLKDAGAREVHLRLSSPELKFPCYYGIDIPTRSELISNRMTPEAIAAHIGADSVMFLPVPELKGCVRNQDDYCLACFNGGYPIDVIK